MIKIPASTYRLQFNAEFPFRSAREIVPYLTDLGISCIYASPIYTATKGSPHGYDVIDTNSLNPELGGEPEFEALIAESQKHGLEWLQDIVPNHMAFDGANPLLADIFENGEASPYYNDFDIQWDHPFEAIRGKVLAPFLGKFFGAALESGELQLKFDDRGLAIQYYAIRFPIKAESYPLFLTHNLEALKDQLGQDHPDLIKYFGILYTLKNLSSAENIEERREQIRFAKRMLWELYIQSPVIREFLDQTLQIFNGKPGEPVSFDPLDRLLGAQMFRLLFWKVATEEINYRRFFNINGLISLRMEEERVFHSSHRLITRLVHEGKIHGLRIDHVDGLYDPAQYLRRIRAQFPDVYLVVEKILEFHEQLPAWPVQGTTGYDFIARLNSTFCDRSNARKFSRIYTSFTGLDEPYEEIVFEKKRQFIVRHMSGEIDRVAILMKNIASRQRHGVDITMYGLKRVLVELLVLYPVYRTYISPDSASQADRATILQVIEKAKQLFPAWSNEIDFIGGFLLMNFAANIPEEEKAGRIHAAMRFQQMTGPLMAKGFEDTTLYVYNRLLSLNEVGGNPYQFGLSLGEFHESMKQRAQLWPHSMNASATHDTKRGEDVRARINVLSEIPGKWEQHLKMWNRMNKKLKTKLRGNEVPDLNEEYALYQILLGSFPFNETEVRSFVERAQQYIVKAVREAKIHTAWLNPDEEYETEFQAFVAAILDAAKNTQFYRSFAVFQQEIAHYGVINSLSQAVIKISAPGVPDFYQGCELWDLSLVDPDNRRPVDYELRKKLLNKIKETEVGGNLTGLISEMLAQPQSGLLKLFTIYRALKLRNEQLDTFQTGEYIPLSVDGAHHENVIAFARKRDHQWILAVVPRAVTSIVQPGKYPAGSSVWADTVIQVQAEISGWRNAITGETMDAVNPLPVATALSVFPVALLSSL